jgi:uncharacterized repeat protein (TIGR02543 family)
MSLIVTFEYKTSSEANCDVLYIKKNGSTLKTCSGSTSYVAYAVYLEAGDTLSFIYSKDGSQASGSDCAYINNLKYTPNISTTSTAVAQSTEVVGLAYKYGSTVTQRVEYGAEYTLPVLTRASYTFLGWYNGSTKVESGTWNINSNVTLTPKWQ